MMTFVENHEIEIIVFTTLITVVNLVLLIYSVLNSNKKEKEYQEFMTKLGRRREY